MISPYRSPPTTELSVPTRVPTWFVVLVTLFPKWWVSHPWYRQARGGRWSYHHFRDYTWKNWEGRWEQVPNCPNDGPSEVFERTDVSSWSCHDGKCQCEVW